MTDEELKAIERRLVIDQDDDADALARHARADASALIAALVATEADRDRAREELAEAESELDGYDKSLKTSYERLAADGIALKELRADRDRARDAAVALEQEVARVQGLHVRAAGLPGQCAQCEEQYPCPTLRALDGGAL